MKAHACAAQSNVVPLASLTAEPLAGQVGSLIFGRCNSSDSLIGGVNESQAMLDFCGQHDLTAHPELIPIQKINEANDGVVKNDLKYRFDIGVASLKKP